MKKRNTSAPSNYYRRALGREHSTPILSFISECLSSRLGKRPKRAESLIKLWSPDFRNPSRPKQNAPSRISNGSEIHILGTRLGVGPTHARPECCMSLGGIFHIRSGPEAEQL